MCTKERNAYFRIWPVGTNVTLPLRKSFIRFQYILFRLHDFHIPYVPEWFFSSS